MKPVPWDDSSARSVSSVGSVRLHVLALENMTRPEPVGSTASSTQACCCSLTHVARWFSAGSAIVIPPRAGQKSRYLAKFKIGTFRAFALETFLNGYDRVLLNTAVTSNSP